MAAEATRTANKHGARARHDIAAAGAAGDGIPLPAGGEYLARLRADPGS